MAFLSILVFKNISWVKTKHTNIYTQRDMKTEHQQKCVLDYSYNLHLRSGVGSVQKADLHCDLFFSN